MNGYMNILLIWNIIVILIYGSDKIFAKRGCRRISEKTLLLCSFLLGGCGAILGMVWFNHKTSKMKFRLIVPLNAIANVIAVYWFYNNVHR